MDNASKGAMQAAEQYGAEQDEAEERSRIAKEQGLNVGGDYFMQVLIDSEEFQMYFADYLIAVDETKESGWRDAANRDLALWLLRTGKKLADKEIDLIMQANADEAKRDEGDPA